MSNTLKNNSYHILGLDVSANQKDLLKRSKEIINRLRIDDDPEYALDIGIYKNFRTESSVKEAVQRLQNPKKKIEEYFFWFQISDDNDEKAIEYLKNKDIDDAIKTWESASNSTTGKSYFYKKNLAILYCLLLSGNDDKKYLSESLVLWKDVIESDRFWTAFEKVYKLHDELSTSQEVTNHFRKNVVSQLSDIYTEIYQLHKNSEYINKFQETFNAQGEKTEKKILEPIYDVLNDAVEELEKLNVSADGVFDKKEAEKIQTLVKNIQEQLNKLIDLGLYEDSRTKVMRDRTANALRVIVLDLHNNLNETKAALGLIKIATSISGTDSFKMKIEQDLKTIQGNVDYQDKEDKYKKILDPIIEKVKSGDADQALVAINQYVYDPNTDEELKSILKEIKTSLEERITKHGKPIKSAPSMFTLNGCGTRIYGDTLYFVLLFIPIFPISRYKVTDVGGGQYSFHGKLDLHPWQKYWKWGMLAVIVIWIIYGSTQK